MKTRIVIAYSVFVALAFAIVARAWQLQISDHAFLDKQANMRQQRIITTQPHRGVIKDRNGEVLALSTPVASIWMNPNRINTKDTNWLKLAKLTGRKLGDIEKQLNTKKGKSFLYVKRSVLPNVAEQIRQLNLVGVGIQSEFKRYYPAGAVTSQLLGFTGIDDNGQEGLELYYNNWLTGEAGKQKVIKDVTGKILDVSEYIKTPSAGKELVLSIDKRIQYEAVKALSEAILKHRAVSGTMVVLKVDTGEVIAMASVPTFNPNNISERSGTKTRNKAVVDTFEPGSTMKTFAVINALQFEQYTPETKINTAPGYMRVGSSTIKDHRNYGMLDLTGVIKKSSNVGISKITLKLEKESLWQTYNDFGFGNTTASGFPGEAYGNLNHFIDWSTAKQATLSYGYGLSVTSLQLANAYNIIAANGVQNQISFLKTDSAKQSKRIISEELAQTLKRILQTPIETGGTATKAAIAGYTVAGKTGTSKLSAKGGYTESRYNGLFAGFVPANNPKFTAVVVINDPKGEEFYGGLVAAPVFATVMSKALRLYNVTPDRFMQKRQQLAQASL